MMEGILCNCPELANQEVMDIFLELGKEKVINNKICIAGLLKSIK